MLQTFFNPSSVALVGASPNADKLSYDILKNLIDSGYKGKIYPINPKYPAILDLPAFASISQLPEVADLAIIAIPSSAVVAILEECGQKGIKNIVIITAGFKEAGEEGAQREEQVKAIGKQYGMRILGPNCLGYINTIMPINASFAQTTPNRGNIAFLSQSGALGTAVIDMARAQQLGFAYFVSMGNKADITEMELLEFWGNDPEVKVIMAYVENIDDGAAFMDVARRVSKKKPVLLIKAGKSEEGMAAASSHTGALAGGKEAYAAAFSQSGVIEVNGLQDLFDFAKAFSYQPLPTGSRVAVVTNAGGPGVLTTDYISDYNLELAELEPATKELLKGSCPSCANVTNPIDILGDARADRYSLALAAAAKDSTVDAIIVVLTPQKMTEIKETVEAIGVVGKTTTKPILLSFLGEYEIEKYYEEYRKYSLPQFSNPIQPVRAIAQMVQYQAWQQRPLPVLSSQTTTTQAHDFINDILKKPVLTEVDCRRILQLYGFRPNSMQFVTSGDEVKTAAASGAISFPAALKVVSPEVVHKSDVGGVKVNIRDTQALVEAIETMQQKVSAAMPHARIEGYLVGGMTTGSQVIVGMKRDPQFGPLIMFGMGGVYAEIFRDVTFRVAPFDKEEALAMITESKVYQMLAGARGGEVCDIDSLVETLLLLSRFALEFPKIQEIDFNPIMVHKQGEGSEIVDARILL
ncbi:MAG: acetate--CoA ligase family protein [bacterium]